MLPSRLFSETVQLAADAHILVLNSAANAFVSQAAQQLTSGTITLAEDNIAVLGVLEDAVHSFQHVPFHEYTLFEPPATMDVALLDLLYQPNNTWIHHALQVAAYALKPGGMLYVVGAKDRGILSVGKRVEEILGNLETLSIQKGHRVLAARKEPHPDQPGTHEEYPYMSAGQNVGVPLVGTRSADAGLANSRLADSLLPVFAEGKLDEGTRLLLDVLEVRQTDEALDIGSGVGYLGLHIARLATRGHVTMVDASLAAVAVARRVVEQSGLTNVRVLPSDGAQAVLSQRFDLVVTNPPFHLGGIQTTEIAERFIREAAQVLLPRGRFYLVANRFLKYEPTLHVYFKTVEEIGGNTRYKVLRARGRA